MKILGIETSCDETSVSVVEDGYKLHSLVVNSQIDIHKAFGGVVPEIAARSHIEVMLPVIEQALGEAKCTWDEIDGIAVTRGPGLLGSLLIGVLTAKTLAWAKNIPLYPVHHIMGHVYANFITQQVGANDYNLPNKPPAFPFLSLVVSGGHSQLMLFESHDKCRIIGKTRDDAVGEAFDKVAKILGLPYPGGPSVSKAAQAGNPTKYRLPIAKLDNPYEFSFSGLKTAVLRAVQRECGVSLDFPSFELAGLLNEVQVNDFAASFQSTAIQTLLSATEKAVFEFKPTAVVLAGGVAANRSLRDSLASQLNVPVQMTDIRLCTDNGAMIAARGFYEAQAGSSLSPHDMTVLPNYQIPQLV